ncbi:MAG: UPF0104 family protein [Deltaproteobacteria bacterium]|nr:MAG: UPF0104 family protein [Deltaproteobacteria bacterium]
MKGLAKGIGVLLFLFILSRIDLGALLGLLGRVDLPLLAVGLFLAVPMVVLKALRWHFFLDRVGIGIGRGEALALYGSGLFLGPATPGRLGEFIRVFYLAERGHPFGTVFYTAFIDRFIDVVALLAIATAGIVFHLARFRVFLLPFLGGGILAIVFLVLLCRPSAGIEGFLRRIVAGVLPNRTNERLDRVYTEFRAGLATLDVFTFSGAFLVTLLCWGIYFYEVELFARALGLAIPFSYLTTVTATATTLGLIPVTIFGLGTRDAVFFLFLGEVHVPRESAEALSLIILLWNLFIVALAFPAWQWAAEHYALDEILRRWKERWKPSRKAS